ncbi:MAG: GIN domain-containing protein [Flavobacteriaceae bacterium]
MRLELKIWGLGLLTALVFWGCDGDNAWDCFQSSGPIVQRSFDVDKFKKIIIWNRVQLIVSSGSEQSVIVESGENLMNEVLVRVEDSILKVSDRNSCNYTRDYGITKVYVTSAVDSLEIRSSSGLPVIGQGRITFRKLILLSEDREQEGEFHTDGDFYFEDLDVTQLVIFANGTSKFFLGGRTNSANIGLYDGDSRIEAPDLEIRNLYLFHRSTNKMVVAPTNLIQGRIVGIGDVICKTQPPMVNVQEEFTGRLLFQ